MRVVHELEHPASKHEVELASKAQARLQLERIAHLAKADTAASEAATQRKKAKEFEDEIEAHARVVDKGVKLVRTECEAFIDRERNMYVVRRIDTKAEVEHLCKPYDAKEHEPLFARLNADPKAAEAKPAKRGAKATDVQTGPASPAPAKKSSKAGAVTHEAVAVFDVEGEVHSVPVDIARSLRSANARTEPFTYTVKGKRVELAFIAGEPVYGVDESGKTYEITPQQVKSIREGKAGGGGCFLHGIGEVVGLALMPGKVHVALPKSTKKGSKRGAKKGSRKSGKAAN